MIIKKLDIENFGKFSGRALDFKPGFNLIYGKNEDGKSTLMAFTKMLFYGNSSVKSPDILKNIRKKYLPWNDAPMSGAAELDINGEILRLHKEFKKSGTSDVITVTNLENGEKHIVSPLEEPGEHFFGMNHSEFERSVFIENYGGFSSEGSTDSLAIRISNLSVSGNESHSQATVQKRMEDAREELVSKSGKKGLLIEEKAFLDSLTAEREQLIAQKEAQAELMKRISKTKEEITKLESSLEHLSIAQKVKIAKKDLVTFTTLKEKYEHLSMLQKILSEYNISKAELMAVIDSGNNLKMHISNCYSAFSQDHKTTIPDSEFTSILEMQKRLSGLASDADNINGIISRTAEAYKATISTKKRKNKLASKLMFGASFISAGVAGLSFLLANPLISLIPGATLFLVFFVLAFVFINKVKNINNNPEVRTAKQEYESALRLLSFYHEALSEKTQKELIEECFLQKQTILNEITEKLDRYECDSIEQMSKQTLSAQNAHYASANEKINKLKQEFISTACRIRPTESFEQADILLSETQELFRKFEETQHDIDTLSKTIVTGRISEDFVKSQVGALTKFIADSESADTISNDNPQNLKEELSLKRQLLEDLQSRIRLPETDENRINSQIANSKEKLSMLTERYDALTLASQALNDAISEMSKGLGSQLNQKTGKYLEMMTNGKYKDVIVSRDLNVETRPDNTQIFHQWKYLSSAAIDRIYLALRLAATDIIAEKNNPLPLFFDDILAQYDDESCENALKFLNKYFRESGAVSQIFFFTCHNHIAEMARNIFSEINEIKL